MRRTCPWLCILIFTLVACGGGGGGGIAVEDIGTELGGAQCSRMFECCDAAELMEELGDIGIENEQECTLFLGGFATQFLVPQLQAAVEGGRLIYHADRMGACFERMRSLSCAELVAAMTGEFPGVLGCEDPFEGQVADGAACATDAECQSDHCSGDSVDFDGNVTEGTCRDRPGVGEPCDDFDCADDAFCESSGQGGPTCQARLAEGSACSDDDDCVSGNCESADGSGAGTCSAELSCDGA